MPVAVLFTVFGDQLPVIPFVDFASNAGTTLPLQIIGKAEKVGVLLGIIVCVNVAVSAHCPAEGVNVYVPVAVLLTVFGDQVPVIPFAEVPGSVGAVAPLQIGGK